MAIDPLNTSGVPDPSVRRPDQSGRPDTPPPARGVAGSESGTEPASDSVELSAEAIRLAAGADIPTDTMPADRLAEITRRLAAGGYDTAQAHDAIARALRGELDAPA